MRSDDLISENYRQLNAKLHVTADFGRHGDKWASKVRELIAAHEIRTVLDYGCGQGALRKALGMDIAEYDPAISGRDNLPSPADLVVCTDVLEHVEPELLSNVLDHLRLLTRRFLFAAVSTRPAVKVLEDGRNAHLIVQSAAAWQPLLAVRFAIVEMSVRPDEFFALLAPADEHQAGRG